MDGPLVSKPENQPGAGNGREDPPYYHAVTRGLSNRKMLIAIDEIVIVTYIKE